MNLGGDKSISHRAAILAAISEGSSTIDNFSPSLDCKSTLSCLQQLGIPWELHDSRLTAEGKGKKIFQNSNADLDAGNSGTTIRLLSGVLVGQDFDSSLTGDMDLRSRPMGRILKPLRLMGADIYGTEKDTAPLYIRPVQTLQGITYELPVASAQLKSCLMLAGLYAKGKTSIIERIETRDHTERLLNVQAELKEDPLGPYKIISVDSSTPVLPIRITVPGDLSSAVFFLVAAALVPEAELILKNVGINPTRTPILNVLKEMGMKIEITSVESGASEPSADLKVTSSELHGVELSGKVIPGIIDEIPALAIAGAITGNFSVRDASELRQKESDRIHSIVKNLRAMGADVYEFADGFSIPKPSKLRGASIESFGDHRITMAFAIAGLLADGITVIKEPDWVNISNPQFWHQFNSIQPHTETEVV